MTVLSKRAIDVFAPTTAGGAPRGADMAETMVWGTEVERGIDGAAAGRVDQSTWAGLAAITGTRAGQPAIVYGPDAGTHTDPVTALSVPNVGEYYWSVSPAGWRRAGNLQRTLAHALNTGTGTANAVQATTDVQFSQAAYAALITLNFVSANTGPMTVSINGETPRELVTNTGQPIPSGYVQPAMSALMQIDSSGDYRLFSYGDASAIQAAAEAAAAAAEAARDAALAAVPNTFAVNVASLKAVDTTQITAAYLRETYLEGQFLWDGSDQSAVLTPTLGTTTSVDATENTATKANHGLDLGDWFFVTSTVNGLTANTIYYAIKVDANTFKVATTRANAVAQPPVAVDLTGTTNFTFKRHIDPIGAVFIIPNGKAFDGSQGAWTRVGWRDGIKITQCGARPVSGFDNATALANAVAIAAVTHVPLRIPTGTFEYSGTLDLGYPGLVVTGAGMKISKLKCTTPNRAIDILENRPNNFVYAYNIQLKDFCVEGNANTFRLILIRMNHAHLENINLREASPTAGIGLRIEGTVSGLYEHVVCSTNSDLMTSRPYQGISIDAEPSATRRASDNTFINCIIEGMVGDGIDIVAGDQNTFIGGTSENNDGNGVTLHPGCQINTLIGMGFENKGYADVYDEGFHTQLINCYGKKNLYIGNPSLFHHTDGGYWDKIEFGAGASFPTVENIKIRFFTGLAAAGLVFNGNQTVTTRNIYDFPTTALIFPKPAIVSPTVGASPYTYTNGTGRSVLVIWSGGTVSQVSYQRSGPQSLLPAFGSCIVQPGDGIQWTFSAAPTVVVLPI